MELKGLAHEEVPSRAFGTKIMTSSSDGRPFCYLSTRTPAPQAPPVPPRRKVWGVLPKHGQGDGQG